MSPKFILLWNDENDPDRNARRVADSLDEAVCGLHDVLNGETVWDEEQADAECVRGYPDAGTAGAGGRGGRR
jgi:hypothetical protein